MKKLATLLIAFTLGACASGVIPMASADQPNMTAALNYLQNAREKLMAASPNKGGHRERAMRLIDDAIVQVREGIEYANQHSNERPNDHGRPRDRY